MLEQIFALVRELLEKTGLIHMDSELSVTVSVITLLGLAASGLLWLGRQLWRGVKALQQQRPIDCLYNALAGYSIVSKTELTYLIRCYTRPRFKGKKQTIRRLLRQIKEASGSRKSSAAVFSIVGAPASGKTAAMRYLYCQLSRSRRCVYLQMQDASSMDALSSYLAEQKAANHIPDQESVVAFFDGLDEACGLFQQQCPDSMEKAVRQLFFQGPGSKIREVFRANNLHLDCSVLSLRPEFLDRSIGSLTAAQYKNISSNVYRLAPMSNGDVIKTFRSLKVLKRLERLNHSQDSEKRHQYRYPPFWKAAKYTFFLWRILIKDPEGLCLFRYPMYIRYAYLFMQEYEKLEAADRGLMSSPNIAVSFNVLVNAMLKWEFHVYYADGSAERDRDAFRAFTGQMKAGAQVIALALLKNQEGPAPQSYLTREQFTAIVEEHFPDEIGRLAMAHCFMMSDDEGQRFAFCHRTFYEYFLARYLFQDGDYTLRKNHLCSDRATDYLRMMYCGILCRKEELNGRISHSLESAAGSPMTPRACWDLEKEETVRIAAEPQISLVELLEYLPAIQGLLYRGQRYSRADLEKLMTSGKLNLQGTGWDRLSYAQWVIPPERVKWLDISWLRLADAGTLHRYQALQYLDIRLREDAGVLDQLFTELEGLSPIWIHVYDGQGQICRRIDNLIRQERLRIQKVYVNAPAYSQAHMQMHQLNQQARDGDLPVRFYLSSRTDLKRAKDKYTKREYKKDIPMLTAVFALEADEDGMLGLDKEGAEASLWNGLSLVSCLERQDYIDEDEQGIQICRGMEPYIPQDSSELSVRFGKIYGALLIMHGSSKQAQPWLSNAYQHGDPHLSKKEMADLGIKLYKALIRSGEMDIDDFQRELLERVEKLPDYETCGEYAHFLNMQCVQIMRAWKKGERAPEDLSIALKKSKKVSSALREKKNSIGTLLNAIYLEIVYANRREEVEVSAQKLEEYDAVMESRGVDTSDRHWQGDWIRYREQKLYRLLLLEEKEAILEITSELLECPFRRGSIAINLCKKIQRAYLSGGDEAQKLDKHCFWDWLWY